VDSNAIKDRITCLVHIGMCDEPGMYFWITDQLGCICRQGPGEDEDWLILMLDYFWLPIGYRWAFIRIFHFHFAFQTTYFSDGNVEICTKFESNYDSEFFNNVRNVYDKCVPVYYQSPQLECIYSMRCRKYDDFERISHRAYTVMILFFQRAIMILSFTSTMI